MHIKKFDDFRQEFTKYARWALEFKTGGILFAISILPIRILLDPKLFPNPDKKDRNDTDNTLNIIIHIKQTYKFHFNKY